MTALRATLVESLEVAKKVQALENTNFAFPVLVRAVKPLVRTLTRLPVGAALIVPTCTRALCLVVERETGTEGGEASYRVGVVATSAAALGFHPQRVGPGGHMQFQTVWSFANVRAARVCCSFWWANLLTASNVAVMRQDKHKADGSETALDGTSRTFANAQGASQPPHLPSRV